MAYGTSGERAFTLLAKVKGEVKHVGLAHSKKLSIAAAADKTFC